MKSFRVDNAMRSAFNVKFTKCHRTTQVRFQFNALKDGLAADA